MTKRFFDIFFSTIGLIILSPLFLVVAVLIKFDSRGPVFFRQARVGINFREFNIYKFRTMVNNASNKGPQITVGGDSRITRVGKVLRRYKIDELPQLLNVLTGDMSLVGPRPEVKKYVELFRSDYENILRVRPGITDPASIMYSNEESMLSFSENWEDDYIRKILPQKIKLSSRYVCSNKNLLSEINIILKTIIKI